MAGNKAIFDTAMKRAHDHAWANQWERALKEYDRALKEFPNDRTVLRNRAQCLLRLRKWQEAETSYTELTVSDPSDLFALNRLAEIYLAQRQMERAVETYNRLADLYIKSNQIHEAIRALLDLSRAVPKDKSVHIRLLKLTQDVGDRRAQVTELIALLKLALEENNLAEAEQYADAASAIDPENPDVRRAVNSVRRKSAEEGGTTTIGEEAKGTASLAGTGLLRRIEPEPAEALALVEEATKAQNKGDSAAALDLYDQAVRAGAKQPSVFYNAGVLNYQTDRPTVAIPFLERASQDREFATSSNYMIGQCHVALEDFASAVVSFERALSGIDLQKITQAEADELLELYTAAAEANVKDDNPGRAASLYTNLLHIFKERKWQHAGLSALEKKADDLYNESIQSKLAGIGRGSGALPADRVAELKLQGSPQEGDEPTRNIGDIPANELTQLMTSLPPGEATQQMGSSILGSIDQWPEASSDQTQMMTDATSKLSQHGRAPFRDGTPTPSPLKESEGQTSMMRQPASNLRTITEYLRASDAGIVDPTESRGQEPVTSGELPQGSLQGDATAMLPEPGLTSSPISGEGNVFHNFSNAALVDMERTSMAVQQLMAEGEFAIGRSQWDTAIDSCMAAMAIDPGYLPVHVLLGDIYVRQSETAFAVRDEALGLNRVETAIEKYQTVLDTYVARREPLSAAELCRRMLQIVPKSSAPSLQTRLGLLLMEGGKGDEAASALLALPESLYKEGETQRALEEALNLKVSLPASSEVALAVGTYLTALGQNQEALVELSRALHLDPSSNKALVRLYVLLASSNEHTQWDALQSVLERAGKEKKRGRLFIEELHAAIRRDPSPALYYGLALLAERSSMEEIAVDTLDEGLLRISTSDTSELKEASPMLEVLMAHRRGDLALSAKEGALATQLYSRAIDVLKKHGGLDTEEEPAKKKDKKGTPATGKMTSPRPQYPFLRIPEPTELYYGLAEAHAIQLDWEGALGALEALKGWMQRDGGEIDHSLHTRIADIYFRQGNLGMALTELNDLLVHYQKRNENDKTLETLGHMARLAPNNVAVRRKLSELYIKLGMTEYGLAELAVLAELQLKAGLLKDAMGSYEHAANLHFTLGQHDKAINIYERIVRLSPRDMEARQQLVNIYIQSGKIAEAVESERSMAELFSHEGQTEGAIAALHQLIALSPDDVPALHMLAQELISIGEYGQAARLYARLLRLDPTNDRIPIQHSEMLRMAREAEENSDKGEKNKGTKGTPQTAGARG